MDAGLGYTDKTGIRQPPVQGIPTGASTKWNLEIIMGTGER
jgi:hypothetical protein